MTRIVQSNYADRLGEMVGYKRGILDINVLDGGRLEHAIGDWEKSQQLKEKGQEEVSSYQKTLKESHKAVALLLGTNSLSSLLLVIRRELVQEDLPADNNLPMHTKCAAQVQDVEDLISGVTKYAMLLSNLSSSISYVVESRARLAMIEVMVQSCGEELRVAMGLERDASLYTPANGHQPGIKYQVVEAAKWLLRELKTKSTHVCQSGFHGVKDAKKDGIYADQSRKRVSQPYFVKYPGAW